MTETESLMDSKNNMGHDWKATWSTPAVTYCDHCGDLFAEWSDTNAVRCVRCGYRCHPLCAARMVIHCSKDVEYLNVQLEPVRRCRPQAGRHSFGKFVLPLLQARYCNVCRGRILPSVPGPRVCDVCGFLAHGSCVRGSPATCIIPFCTVRDFAPRHHHMVEGNLPPNSVCAYCCMPIAVGSGLTGVSCYWCNSHLHNGCVEHVPLCAHTMAGQSTYKLADTVFYSTPAGEMLTDPEVVQALVSSVFPVFAIVNSMAGSKMGPRAMRLLKRHLNPLQIYEAQNDGIRKAIQCFLPLAKAQIQTYVMVMGGDGSLQWMCDEMKFAGWPDNCMPHVALIPLGTANEVARVLGWGTSVDFTIDMRRLLDDVRDGELVWMDRWHTIGKGNTLTEIVEESIAVPLGSDAQVSAIDSVRLGDVEHGDFQLGIPIKESLSSDLLEENMKTTADVQKRNVPSIADKDKNQFDVREFNVNFSFGVDAEVVLRFHETREKQPWLCTNRTLNMLQHVGWGAFAAVPRVGTKFVDLREMVKIRIDGVELELPAGLGTIAVVNAPSYAAGLDLWGLGGTSPAQPLSNALATSVSSSSALNELDKDTLSGRSSGANPSFTSKTMNRKTSAQLSMNQSHPPTLVKRDSSRVIAAAYAESLGPSVLDDGIVEVVGTYGSLHIARLQLGVPYSATVRLGRGSNVELEFLVQVPAQVDGEPWLQQPGVVRVERFSRIPMLKRRPSSGAAAAPSATSLQMAKNAAYHRSRSMNALP